MEKIISLTKTLYKVNKNSASKMSKKAKIVLYIFLIAYLVFIFSAFWGMFINPLNEMGQAQKSIDLMISIVSIFLITTSITSVANILFFSEDTKNILPLPFTSKDIFSAKLLTSYLYALIINFMILLPGLLAYYYITKASLIFCIYAFLVILLLPIIPILIVSLIYTIIMPFLKFVKYKNLFKIVTTILILVLVLGFQLKLNSNLTDNGEYSGEYIIELSNKLPDKLIFVKPAIASLQNSENLIGLIFLTLYAIINVILSFLIVTLFSNLYIKGVYANISGNIKSGLKKKIKNYKPKSQYMAIIVKDLKGLFRNATFFIQCVFPSLLMPIIVIIISLSNISQEVNTVNGNIGDLKVIFGIIMIQFFFIMNHVSVTAFSRDGKDEALYMKSLPISLEKQINSKAIPGILIGTINLVISLAFIYIVAKLNLLEILVLLISGMLLNVIQSYLLLIIDLVHPKIYWESEMAVVKHNINFVYALIIEIMGIIFTSLIAAVTIPIGFSLIYICILLSVYIAIKIFIHYNAQKLYSKIF